MTARSYLSCIVALSFMVCRTVTSAAEELVQSDGTSSSDPTLIAGLNKAFRESVATVDRIVVLPPDPGSGADPHGDGVLFEVSGKSELTGLFKDVEIVDWSGIACLCLGEARIEFYAGGSFLFSCSYRHFRFFESSDAPWTGMCGLSEKAQAHIIGWFAEHGFPQFRDWKAAVEKNLEEIAATRARAFAHLPVQARERLPDNSESYAKEPRRVAAEFAADFGRKVDMIHACWRAVGILRPPRSYSEHSRAALVVLWAALDLATAEELRAALETLPDDDATVLGAYSQVVDASDRGAMAQTIDTGRLSALALRVLEIRGPESLWSLVRQLKRVPRVELFPIAMKIIEADRPKKSIETPYSAFADAAMLLASQRFEPARAAMRERVVNPRPTDTQDDRLTLEVALAVFADDPESIRIDHLKCGYDGVPDAALRLLLDHRGANVPLEFIAEAAQSVDDDARRQAAEYLDRRGLRIIERDPVWSDDDAATEAWVAGRKLLVAGEFAKARDALRKSKHREAFLDLTLVNQTLGRFFEADEALRRAMIDDAFAARQAADLLLRRGAVHFAQGQFAEASNYFSASLAVDHEDVCAVLQHLALLHTGDIARSAIAQIDNSLSPENASPPQAVIFLLHGKLSETETLERVKPTMNEIPTPEGVRYRALAHFVVAELCRLRGDTAGERTHLEDCVATKAYATQAVSLAIIRLRDLRKNAPASAGQNPTKESSLDGYPASLTLKRAPRRESCLSGWCETKTQWQLPRPGGDRL